LAEAVNAVEEMLAELRAEAEHPAEPTAAQPAT